MGRAKTYTGVLKDAVCFLFRDGPVELCGSEALAEELDRNLFPMVVHLEQVCADAVVGRVGPEPNFLVRIGEAEFGTLVYVRLDLFEGCRCCLVPLDRVASYARFIPCQHLLVEGMG